MAVDFYLFGKQKGETMNEVFAVIQLDADGKFDQMDVYADQADAVKMVEETIGDVAFDKTGDDDIKFVVTEGDDKGKSYLVYTYTIN